MTRERFLTVKQPWASLVIAGIKPVKNKSKPFPSTVPLPARVWIHAGLKWDDSWGWSGFINPRLNHRLHGDLPLGLMPGHIADWQGVLLGYVTVTGCHHAGANRYDERRGDFFCSTWAQPDAFHWTLADPVALSEPIPMKGMLGLPFLPDDVQAAAYAQLEAVSA